MYVYRIRSLSKPAAVYVGVTANIGLRLFEHNSGKSYHTAKNRPWRVEFYCWFKKKEKAWAFEKYLKSGSGRAFSNKHF